MTSRASRRLIVCVAMLTAALTAPAGAQSLAEVARAEQARRKEQPKAGKVYTNDSVKADTRPSSAAAGGTPARDAAPAATRDEAAEAARATPADAAAPPAGERRDEAYWKARISAAREQLARSRTFAEALQTRINTLSVDFVNRDDPAQQRLIAQNRTKAVAELDRVQREIASHTEAVAAIEDEARKAGVPPGWLR